MPLAPTARPRLGMAHAALALLAIALLALPWFLHLVGLDFYLSLASRILVYAIAATSLNLVLGYGGDEGLTIRVRSLFVMGDTVLDLKNPRVFYYVALGVLAASLFALRRFVPSRFGRAMLAVRDDDIRAEAIGFPTYRYKLIVFMVAGIFGGIAGGLSVNLQGYVSPNVLHWTQSGTLMVMVILGGVATIWGGFAGAAVLLLLQEILASWTQHPEFWTGWVLLAVVLFARRGLVGLFASRAAPPIQ